MRPTRQIGFYVDVTIENIRHDKEESEWKLRAEYCQPDDYRPAPRIEMVMETYVKPVFLPHVREILRGCLDELRARATAAATVETVPAAETIEVA